MTAAATSSAALFTVYPAIDVRRGSVVRLEAGDYGRETRYLHDPVELACDFARDGGEWLHLVDLDAARSGGYTLRPLLTAIGARTAIRIQTGGGVRSEADIEALLSAGASRVVVGTLAVTDPERALEWIRHFGPERLCIAIDVRLDASGNWVAATHGWTEGEGTMALELIRRLRGGGMRHLLSTDIARDGMLVGPALDWYAELARVVPEVAVQASGGMATLADIAACRDAGCSGVVIGKALLEGRFTLAEALAC